MKHIILIINLRSLVVTSLALLSTWICIRHDIKANFPITLLITAVVFPVAFSIHSAYERRERALQDYASLKTQGRALFYATRDWLDESTVDSRNDLRLRLHALLSRCVTLLSDSPGRLEENEQKVYDAFSDLSFYIREQQRGQGLAATEVSRANQYLNSMLQAFESIKHIYQYRTPQTLKVFGSFFVMSMPPLYGPYFSYMSDSYFMGLQYVMPVMFAVIMTALVNIQEQLENPFDQYGEDDVRFNVEKYIASLEHSGKKDV